MFAVSALSEIRVKATQITGLGVGREDCEVREQIREMVHFPSNGSG
jgi:hypothetical protein